MLSRWSGVCRAIVRTAIPFAILFLFPILGTSAADPVEANEFFEANVRPVFVEMCGKCHGAKKQQGGLRLDSRATTLAGGETGPAVVAGQPDKSLLITAVRRKGDLKMPPDAPLKDAQIAALTRWVELGAPWPADKSTAQSGGTTQATTHWAFQPVRNHEPPTVREAAWVRTPVDRFVLARLEAEGLRPSQVADKRTLIRRATYDLTGLPPTPAEVEAFVRDESPTAYARLIDRLLASPRYGEQWGRHWLDVARYSDAKGYVYAREERFWVHAWAYRDWVIRALNQDMPYDRFLTLQLAADQVAPNDPPAQAAMGYLTLGRRFLGVSHDIIDDRIDVVTRGMLGLSASCARCHDHKFDPIPTDDYYSLYGIFRSCSERQVPAGGPAPKGAEGEAFARGLAERQKKLDDALALRRNEASARARARVGDYLEAQLELSKYPEEGFDQILSPNDVIPETVRRWRDYLARTAANRDRIFAPWHSFARLSPAEFLTRAAEVCKELVARPKNEVNPLVLAAFVVPPRDMREVARRYGSLFARVGTPKELAGALAGGPAAPVLGHADPDEDAVRRVLFGPDSPCSVPDEPIVNVEAFLPTREIEAIWKLQAEVDRWLIRATVPSAYATVLVDRAVPTNARVFRRGNPATPGAEVPRQFLGILAGPGRQPFHEGSGRVELARAITSPTNPLTARVMVNRVWLHHFGAGLVRTPSDFGTRAEPPSHPELLDWLAQRFMADGWSLKTLHRQIMLSAVYQQASTGSTDPTTLARDPENRLLWRMNARRLTFEELRDSLFAVTAELDLREGGKPVDLLAAPYPPRRAVYGLVDREYFPNLLRTFDFANPDLHIPQRSETTVPQQALFFLNHQLPIDRAKTLAKNPTVIAATTPEEKVARLYRLIYQRDATPTQVRASVGLVQAAEEDARPTVMRPKAWTYGYGAYDPKAGKLTSFHPLPYFTGSAWQGGPNWPDASLGWTQLTATGGHPGNDLTHAAVRRWTAPRDCVVRISSELVHDVAQGDGVRASIVSSRHGLLKSVVAHNSRVDVSVPLVVVRAGDTIDFVVDIRDGLNNDQHLWSPTISVVTVGGGTGSTWNAKTEFGGTTRPALGPWEQLAQTLLMANEFSFVD
ncbi:PSD1 and planctomycete cytochrome C domain-containing protein [Fimbriiglobus ruber]|uniref:Cytochrome c domain-containing protein n=1 Tax=Fimbriiglobus ruber TaxID=1908690 RepID=A0A225DLT8_9BACT|nr:PSD1 and planctomycete cytochrome C domain-containing protein [Fimbriiglobus ruber]OWK40584.1 hypothetical protein FRUB_05503 [Fimbriiglobus ruber]